MTKYNKKIVVMGGSFNPPTLAHHLLMRQAIDALNADMGIFVPVSDAYLRRKLCHNNPPVIIDPEMRIKMLQAMCTDSRMTVSRKEIGTIKARTMPTLIELQADYPDAEIFFVMGADKLELLLHLTEKHDLLKQFNVVLFSRDNTEIENTLKESNALMPYLHRIVVLNQPEGTKHISSSKVRERMLAGESSQDMLHPGVWDLFKTYCADDFPNMITQFKHEYDFLSNSYPCRFVWQGLSYANAEAAFQSSKYASEEERKTLSNSSAEKAANMGSKLKPHPGWEENQLNIMQSIVEAKFEQNPDLMNKLIETGNATLVNGNSKQETFWGIDLYSWQGENNLGKILMTLRKKHTTNEIFD
ncbi:MAG: NADAR domain-containing protein [Muribaculaceae bacterium]